MNADLQKLRDSRLFRKLPDRAFEKILKYIKVRAFTKAEQVADVSGKSEFQRYFGYLITGRVVFLSKERRPIGMAIRDEFFLGRSFSIQDESVAELVSGHEQTLLVWIPKEIMEVLASNSESFAEILEEIYDSIFERSEFIASDASAKKKFDEWVASSDSSKTLSSWIGELEKKKDKLSERFRKNRKEKVQVRWLWVVGILMILLPSFEAFGNIFEIPVLRPSLFFGIDLGEYAPGSTYNIVLGIIGYSFLLFTNVHTVTKLCIRKLNWKLDYKFSSRLHILFGAVGAAFVLLHACFYISGANVAHYALYALFVTFCSGVFGQLVSNQIPKTIQGEKMRLGEINAEKNKLHRQAELLMDDNQMKTSIAILAPAAKKSSFWWALIDSPLLWLRSRKVKKALQKIGLGQESASLASSLLRRQFQIEQKLKFLQMANAVFKRWMFIHKPFGYALYGLGLIHILLSVVLA